MSESLNFERKGFLAALEAVKNTVDKKDVLPMLTHVRVTPDGFITYDRRLFSFCGYDTQGLDCLVPFSRLYDFVKLSKAEMLAVDLEGTELRLACGKSRSNLSLMNAAEYPDLTDHINTVAINSVLLPKDFAAGITAVVPFVYKDSSRPNLAGVNLSGMALQCTDSIRIAEYYLAAPVSLPVGEKGVLIPTDLAQILAKCTGDASIYIDETKIGFCVGSAVYVSSRIKSEYPDVSRFFPDSETTQLHKLPKVELIDGLNRVGKFSDEINADTWCRVEFGDTLKVSYQGHIAQITEFFDFGQQLSADPFEVNPYHFMALLKSSEQFAFTKVGEAQMLYGEQAGAFRCILAIRRKG